jgi:hypothetical protein
VPRPIGFRKDAIPGIDAPGTRDSHWNVRVNARIDPVTA